MGLNDSDGIFPLGPRPCRQLQDCSQGLLGWNEVEVEAAKINTAAAAISLFPFAGVFTGPMRVLDTGGNAHLVSFCIPAAKLLLASSPPLVYHGWQNHAAKL